MKNNNDLKEFIGTREFKAPEIIKKKAHDGQKADIFSLGQILIYIVFGKPGFDNPDSNDEMYYLINENEEKKTKEEKEGEGGFGRAFVIYDRETKKEYISKFIII